MAWRVLDTSVLISYWRFMGGRPGNVSVAMTWAHELQSQYRAESIVSPVYLEFICGVTSDEELAVSEAFLNEFDVRDDWEILPADLEDARRIAKRIPQDATRRQLGVCLIRALAHRLRCEVVSLDTSFPR